jgi:hypothetical protein
METWFRALGDVAYAIVAGLGLVGVALAAAILIGVVLLLTTAMRRRR